MGKLSGRTIWIEEGISLFLAAFFIFFHAHIDGWVVEAMPSTISPAFFPTVVTRVLIVMSLALVGISSFDVWRMSTGGEVSAEDVEPEGKGRMLALLAYVLILFLYLAGMHFVGFVVATPLVMLAVALLLGIRRWFIGLLCYIAFTLALNYASFHYMQIILPAGILFE